MCKITKEEDKKIEKVIREGLEHTPCYSLFYPSVDTIGLNVDIWCNDEPYTYLTAHLIKMLIKKTKSGSDKTLWKVEVNNQICTMNREPIYHTYTREYTDDTLYDELLELCNEIYRVESETSELEVEDMSVPDNELDTFDTLVSTLKPWHEYAGILEDDYGKLELTEGKWSLQIYGFEPNHIKVEYNHYFVMSCYPEDVCGMAMGMTDIGLRKRLYEIFLKIKK